MPLIQVTIIEGRPKEKVAELIGNLTKTTVETLGAPQEAVRVLVNEIPASHWGVAGKPKG